MKTAQLLFTLCMIGIVSTGFAKPNTNIDRELEKVMTFPSFDSENASEGIVHCSFYFDDECRIIFKNLEGTNPSLEAYVLDKLYDLKCPIVKNEIYSFRFVFKKER